MQLTMIKKSGRSFVHFHHHEKLATTLKELNEEEMKLIGLIGNLKTHEMARKAREEMAPQKKTISPSSLLLPSPTMKKKKMMKIYLSS